MKEGGVPLMVKQLHMIYTSTSLSNDDMETLYNLLFGLKILTKVDIDALLHVTDPPAMNVIALNVDNPILKIKSEVLSILNKASQIHQIAHGYDIIVSS
jgi:hypothetical protein